jgi:hypothetical protein
MANVRTIYRSAATAVVALVIVACAGATAPSAPPDAPATASPIPTTSPTPAVTETPSVAPATPLPSRKPRPSLDVDLAELDAYMTSSITFLNLADDDLAVVVAYLDPGSEVPFPLGTYALESMDQVTNDAPPGTYTLEFHQPAADTSPTTCTIQIADTEGYVFAALGDAIGIRSSAFAPSTASDLFVATSPLCVDRED